MPRNVTEYMREWRKKNPNKAKEYRDKIKYGDPTRSKWYYEKDRYNRKRNREKLRLAVIKYYSNGLMECGLCGCDIYDVLDVDHIHGGGNEHRRRVIGKSHGGGYLFYLWLRQNNFPDGYRILCKNCNWLESLKEKKPIIDNKQTKLEVR